MPKALQAPMAYLDSVKSFDIDVAQNICQVGGSKQFSKAILISGSDRFDTCQAVLSFIKNGVKLNEHGNDLARNRREKKLSQEAMGRQAGTTGMYTSE